MKRKCRYKVLEVKLKKSNFKSKAPLDGELQQGWFQKAMLRLLGYWLLASIPSFPSRRTHPCCVIIPITSHPPNLDFQALNKLAREKAKQKKNLVAYESSNKY